MTFREIVLEKREKIEKRQKDPREESGFDRFVRHLWERILDDFI